MTQPAPARPGFFRRLFRGTAGPSDGDVQAGAYLDGIPVLGLDQVAAILGGGSRYIRVNRYDANRLPSVVAVRNRLQATINGMPLEQRKPDGTVVANPWLQQPNPSRPLANEMADTVADMFYDKLAYWRVLQRGPGKAGLGSGFPTHTEHIATDRVTIDPDGGFRIDGAQVPSASMIKFEGIHGGILHEGTASAINDALRLQRMAALFTNSPFPLGYFQAVDVDPDPEESAEFLSAWHIFRRRNAWGIVPPSLKLEIPDWDPAKLQLAEARNETTRDIARGTGEDLENLGISTTSRTYLNATQQRKDQLDEQVALYTEPIAQRLSMPDITPRGHVVKFNTGYFLSVDELTRAQIEVIQLQTGVLADEDEARAKEGKPPLTPEQIERRKALKVGPAEPPAAKSSGPAPAGPAK